MLETETEERRRIAHAFLGAVDCHVAPRSLKAVYVERDVEGERERWRYTYMMIYIYMYICTYIYLYIYIYI